MTQSVGLESANNPAVAATDVNRRERGVAVGEQSVQHDINARSVPLFHASVST
jgi:hypothetical protein